MIYESQRRWNSSDAGRAAVRKYKASAKGAAAVILANCRARALGCQKHTGAVGRPMTLTQPWLLQRILKGFCSATGIAFALDGPTRWKPSPDRQDGSKGYSKGNVRVTLAAFNKTRRDNTDPVFIDNLVDSLRVQAKAEGIPMRRRPRRLTRKATD
jgi:hypothetical protein